MARPFVRRPLVWTLIVGLLIVVFALSACGGSSDPATTVNVNETHSATGDVYTCNPTSITINKGDTVNFINNSDENQDFDQGDAQKAGVDFVIAINGSKSVTFNTSGTFTIKSEKGATIKVTVN